MSVRGDLQRAGLIFVIGSIVIAGSAVGFAIGYLLDNNFNTKPWLMIVFTSIGVAVGFIQAYRTGRRFFKN